MITDHGSFVLFNVYGPAVTNEEAERFAMKLTLYEVHLRMAQTQARQGMYMQCQAPCNCLWCGNCCHERWRLCIATHGTALDMNMPLPLASQRHVPVT